MSPLARRVAAAYLAEPRPDRDQILKGILQVLDWRLDVGEPIMASSDDRTFRVDFDPDTGTFTALESDGYGSTHNFESDPVVFKIVPV